MSDVKLCDCCGKRIAENETFRNAWMEKDTGSEKLDVCDTCIAVIVEEPLAPIRKVRRQRKAKA